MRTAAPGKEHGQGRAWPSREEAGRLGASGHTRPGLGSWNCSSPIHGSPARPRWSARSSRSLRAGPPTTSRRSTRRAPQAPETGSDENAVTVEVAGQGLAPRRPNPRAVSPGGRSSRAQCSAGRRARPSPTSHRPGVTGFLRSRDHAVAAACSRSPRPSSHGEEKLCSSAPRRWTTSAG
jgi:hypothetical protein